MKGISSQKRCKCKQHEFILKPLSQQVHRSKKVQISLCESVSKNQRRKVLGYKSKCCPCYPIFNRDKNHSTPAFILENEKQHFLENRNIYLNDHSRITRQYELIPNEIYFPVPKSDYDFCNVCCVSYSDHMKHINCPEHHNQIRLTKFNEYILDLTETFKKKQLQKTSKRSMQSRSIVIDDDSQVGLSGQKKIKTEEKTSINEKAQQFSQNGLKEFKEQYYLNNYIYMDPAIKGPTSIQQNQLINPQMPLQINNQAPQCLNFNYNELMHSYFISQLAIKSQTSLNNTNYPDNRCQHSPEIQQFFVHENPYLQQNNIYPLDIDHNFIRYNAIHGYNYQTFLMQSSYLFFNNFNIPKFTTWQQVKHLSFTN